MQPGELVHWLRTSPQIYRSGWTLLHSLWEFSAAAVILAQILRLLVNASPRVRYGVTVVALLAMLALPLLTFQFIGALSPPAAALTATEPISLSASATPSSGVTLLSASSPERPVTPQKAGALEWAVLSEVADTLAPALPWVMGFWFIGVVGFGIWHFGGWVATQRLRSLGTSPADFHLTETLTHLAARIGLTRPVRIAKSIMVQTPVVIGYIRPVILIPSSVLSGLPPTHLEAILAHELAHIRRHDGLINLMQAAVETVLFYHPAIWWVSRQMREERELCCDDIAVGVCGDRRLYAQALISLEELRPPATSLAMAATGAGRQMFARIQRLIGRPRRARYGLGASLPAVILTLGVLLFPLLHERISAQAAPPSATAPSFSDATSKVFKQLTPLLTSKNYDAALALLDSILPTVPPDSYDQAAIENDLGGIWIQGKEQPEKAIQPWEHMLDITSRHPNYFPATEVTPKYYYLATIYLQLATDRKQKVDQVTKRADLDRSLEDMRRFLQATIKPTSEQLYFYATDLYLRATIDPKVVDKAILEEAQKQAEAGLYADIHPKESFYQLLIAAYTQEGELEKASDYIELVIKNNPTHTKNWWPNLFANYNNLAANNEKNPELYRKYLARDINTLERAQQLGFMKDKGDNMNLITMYTQAGQYGIATDLLSKDLQNGTIDPARKESLNSFASITAETDDPSKRGTELDLALGSLKKAKEQESREEFELLKRLEQVRVDRKSAELEIQRMVEVARRAEAGAKVQTPPPAKE